MLSWRRQFYVSGLFIENRKRAGESHCASFNKDCGVVIARVALGHWSGNDFQYLKYTVFTFGINRKNVSSKEKRMSMQA